MTTMMVMMMMIRVLPVAANPQCCAPAIAEIARSWYISSGSLKRKTVSCLHGVHSFTGEGVCQTDDNMSYSLNS